MSAHYTAIMTTTKTAYDYGFEDGAEAFRTSGTTAAPVDGWDADLINSLGFSKVCELLGLDAESEKGGWSEFGMAALAEYCRGCQAGAEAESAS